MTMAIQHPADRQMDKMSDGDALDLPVVWQVRSAIGAGHNQGSCRL